MAATQQKFLVSLLKEARFEGGGLRSYFVDRDLGFAEASGGLVTALVHRAAGKCPQDVRQPHLHRVDFQMNYVLKGWCRFEFDGHGEQRFEAGDAWLQPPEIEHALLAFSDDFEVLEIVMPADFDTVDL
jgi:hypothetical protein